MTSIDEPLTVIISAPGSRGDVNPMIAIGRELRGRGCKVVISLAENYRSHAEEAGLNAQAVVSREDFDAMTATSQLWHPIKGIRTVLRDAATGFLRPHLKVIQQHHRPGRTILVAHPLDFASRIYCDFDPSTPLVSVHLSPAMKRDVARPPRLLPSHLHIGRPQWLVRAAYHFGDYGLGDHWLASATKPARRELSLPSARRTMYRSWFESDLVLGLYPDWFGYGRPEGVHRWHACGFPTMQEVQHDSSRVDVLINNTMDRSSPPVFATPGTAHRHARQFFENVARASALAGLKCILATNFPEQLPDPLPAHATAMGYVPLDPVLRSCAAIVHHGGVGTTAMALKTACPQIICPLAFDQFHHADEIERLGVGHSCKASPWKQNRRESALAVAELSQSLTRITKSAATRENCQRFARNAKDFDGAAWAAAQILSLPFP